VNVLENNSKDWEDEFQEVTIQIEGLEEKQEEEENNINSIKDKKLCKFNSEEIKMKNYLTGNSDKTKTTEDLDKLVSIKSVTNSEKIRYIHL
jgi:hypothetical protein